MALREQQLEDPLLENGDCGGGGEADVEEISSCGKFLEEAVRENKKLWYLAGPAIFTSIAQYSLGAITQVFAGHLTTLELDAVSTENMVIANLAFGIMLGLGSALETLCGQAYGAKQLHMLGVYMQRSWIILTGMCICLLPIYLFAAPILRLFGQEEEIAAIAGRFSLYMIPQLFAYGINIPIQKFLQAQSKVMPMASVSAAALLLHVFLSWLFISRLGLGLPGAAASLNIAWWVVVLGQFAYIVLGYCPCVWTGFSWGAFKDLGAFTRLSIASAIMLCLEVWYYMLLFVLAGRLKDAQIAVAAISICMYLSGWESMVFVGFNAAISVRISNELGAGRPRAAKFAILVVVVSSALLGFLFMALVLVLKDVYALPFTNSAAVAAVVSNVAVIFSLTLLLNSIQPVLTGVAVGAGWQSLVAYVNVGCYYVVGLPLGFLLGSYFDLGVEGILSGMITGALLQTIILTAVITFWTNWNKEAEAAESRIRKWGGSVENQPHKMEVALPYASPPHASPSGSPTTRLPSGDLPCRAPPAPPGSPPPCATTPVTSLVSPISPPSSIFFGFLWKHRRRVKVEMEVPGFFFGVSYLQSLWRRRRRLRRSPPRRPTGSAAAAAVKP